MAQFPRVSMQLPAGGRCPDHRSLLRCVCAEIESAYEELGHRLGWRFLNSPSATLAPGVPIALITMNPGGGRDEPEYERGSWEAGSAYVDMAWPGYRPGEAPLQRQIRALFALLAAEQCAGADGDDLLRSSLAAYFVPFRSPTFAALARRRESLAFAAELWSGLFRHIDPRLVVTIDRATTDRVVHILSTRLGGQPVVRPLPIAWGRYCADVITFDAAQEVRLVLRLPHLSRFQIFSRSASAPAVHSIVREVGFVLR